MPKPWAPPFRTIRICLRRRHHASKGLPDLIWAFCQTQGDARLKIWGYNAPGVTGVLQAEADALGERARRIEWMGPFEHTALGAKVLDHAHALVVPSIWEENSPLVIHEAQENRLPVITANVGGMAEYVHDEINGLLFKHRDRVDLARAMQAAIDDPAGMVKLGKRGYLNASDGSIPDVAEHVRTLSEALEDMSTVDDKVIQRGANMLLTFTNILTPPGPGPLTMAAPSGVRKPLARSRPPATSAAPATKAISRPGRKPSDSKKPPLPFSP